MRVVLLPAVAGRETGQIMTNSRKRHTPEQVVRKLGQADRMLADGQDVAAVCRELGVSEQTYYRWRNQYGGLKADDAKRLKELEQEMREASRATLQPSTPAPTTATRSPWSSAWCRCCWWRGRYGRRPR